MRPSYSSDTEHDTATRGLRAQLDLLQSIIAIWTDTESIDDAGPRVLDAVCDTLDWDVGAIWVVDGAAGLLRCLFVRDRGDRHAQFAALSRQTALPYAVGLPGAAWSTAAPLWLEDLPDEPAYPRFTVARAEGLRSSFAFPIISGDGVFGVLEFFSRTPHATDHSLLVMMRTIGSYAGLFVERKRAEDVLRAREAEYRSLAECMPAVVCRADRDGRLTYFNRRWYDYTGLTPADMTAETIRNAIHPDDRDPVSATWRTAIARGNAQTIEFRLRRSDGAFRWHLGQLVPVHEAQGHIGWVSSSVDIDDRKRAEVAAQFLLDAGQALASSLDYETTLRTVTRLAVPAIADLCSVDLLDSDDALVRVALTCVDPQQQALFDAMPARFSPDPKSDHPARRVLRTGRGDCIPIVSDEDLLRVARDDEHLRLLRALDVRSAIMVPLIAHDRKYGTMLFVTTRSRRTYAPDDRRLAEALSGRAAFAIDNARLYRDSHALASDLQAANAAKDEFLSLVSHELRTPLTTILGNAEVLQRAGARMDEADRAGALADVRSDARRLARIIDNMLTLARLDRGHAVDREPVLLGRVIENAIARHRERYHHRELRTELAAPLPVVEGNAEYIEQIMENLLTNAEKHGDPQKPIIIRACLEDDAVTVSVIDGGTGISPEDVRRIFEPFERGAGSGAVQGLGVGLTVCKRLAEAQGGRIWAEPRPGGGSIFSFTLTPAADPTED